MKKQSSLIILLITMFILGAIAPVAALKGVGIFAANTAKFWYSDQSKCFIVGRLIVSNDADNLYIRFQISDEYIAEWFFYETHLAFGWNSTEGLIGIPITKKGNPQVGKFPYKTENNLGETTVEYTIPLDDIFPLPGIGAPEKGGDLVIAAHSVVANPGTGQEETAWANCQGPTATFSAASGRNGKGNWATWIIYDNWDSPYD